jgi:hypothetical protein
MYRLGFAGRPFDDPKSITTLMHNRSLTARPA